MKLHLRLEWHIFHILTSKDIGDFTGVSSLSLKLYLNLLVHDRNIFGSSSKVFGNLWKFSKNVWERSSSLRNNYEKSSESGWKSSENQTRRYQYV